MELPNTHNSSWYGFESSIPLPEIRGKSDILLHNHIKELSKFLPARAEGYAWTLAFTTSHMGFSLKSLYRSLAKYEGPVLLIIKDTDQAVFGAFCSCSLQCSESFYGTGETYLFTFKNEITKSSATATMTVNNNNNPTAANNQQLASQLNSNNNPIKRFPWTGDNLYFIKGNSDSLVVGAGDGNFGLWLDEDLYHGTSHICKTFNNEPLTHKEDFVVSALECWCFL